MLETIGYGNFTRLLMQIINAFQCNYHTVYLKHSHLHKYIVECSKDDIFSNQFLHLIWVCTPIGRADKYVTSKKKSYRKSRMGDTGIDVSFQTFLFERWRSDSGELFNDEVLGQILQLVLISFCNLIRERQC
jgi:hypothetical protein